MANKLISYCVDADGRITSLCPHDMAGNSDWYTSTVETLGLGMDAELWDDHGAAMYRLEDGVAVPRSEAERQADWLTEEEPEPTEAEQLAQAARILFGEVE